MGVDFKEFQNFHHNRIQQEAKPSDEEVAEDYDFVGVRLRFNLTNWRRPCEANFKGTSSL